MDEEMRRGLTCCPVNVALSHIDKKWTINIIKNIYLGSTRFNQIKKDCDGISAKVLAERLKEMEEKELIVKNYNVDDSFKLEYALTRKGAGLNKVIYELAIYTLDFHRDEAFIGSMRDLGKAKKDVEMMFLGVN